MSAATAPADGRSESSILSPPVISIRIPANLRLLTSGCDVIQAEGNSVREVFASLDSTFPELHDRFRAPDGQLRRNLLVFVNGEDIRFGNGEETALNSGDEISIVPALAGG
jgi:molybdopterin synthase sulfur carrier subunit